MSETITPKQLEQEGKQAFQRGDYRAAAHAFETASMGYHTLGDELSCAEMRNNSSVAYLKAGDAQAALRIIEGTLNIFAKAEDIRRQGMALGNLGAAQEALEYFDEAIESYEQSAELLKKAGEDELRASVMQSLSALLLRTGRQLEAVAVMQTGLESIKRPSIKQRLVKKLLELPYSLFRK